MINFPILTFRLPKLQSIEDALHLEEKLFALEGVRDAAVSFEKRAMSVVIQDNLTNEDVIHKALSTFDHSDLKKLPESENLFLNNVIGSFGYPFSETDGNTFTRRGIDKEGEISSFQDNAPGDTFRYQCGSSYLHCHRYEIRPEQVKFALGMKIGSEPITLWGRRLQMICDKCYCCAGFLKIKALLKLL